MALERYIFFSSVSTISEVVEELNDIFDDLGVEFGINSVYITFKGKLWNAHEITGFTTFEQFNTQSIHTLYLDKENHFMLYQNGIVTGMGANIGTVYSFGSRYYFEDLEGHAVFNMQVVDNATQVPFCCSGDNYIEYLFNISSANNTSYNALDLGEEFDLIPARCGLAEVKRLFVSTNNRCMNGQCVNVGYRKFRCVGRQIFYEITESED